MITCLHKRGLAVNPVLPVILISPGLLVQQNNFCNGYTGYALSWPRPALEQLSACSQGEDGTHTFEKYSFKELESHPMLMAFRSARGIPNIVVVLSRTDSGVTGC